MDNVAVVEATGIEYSDVVIVGSGFGGLAAAKQLAKSNVDYVLISSTPEHLFQPLLYQVATGVLAAEEIAPPIAKILRRHDTADVRQGTVVAIEPDTAVLTYRTPGGELRRIRYGSLIAATGASQSYFGRDDFAEKTYSLKTIEDAKLLRAQIERVFTEAATADEATRQRLLSFVVVGAGATGVAAQIMAALAGPGAELVTATPTFDGYPILAEMTGTVLVPVPCDAAGAPDPAALGMAVHKRTALVVICRPHNPTGALITAAALRAFLRGLPERVTVVLDEAYVEFLAPADRLDTTALLRAHPNVLVLRTFSKAYGLAGLRIGYAFGDRARMASVRRHQLPFGVPATATAAVAACYAARPELTRRVARITAERDGLRAALRARGRAVPRSHANFLYLPGPGVATALRRAGITAKAYPDGSARIAVGDPAAGRAVLAALTGGGSMDG
ncbi:aminotransferase class I/II-fold pyridoxal phosphate-dependent enzyme [Nocardia farcinica]|uniref:aminotransferase class I/II-fold pyridoxal phosphate-dependent enzyme n=2 Tax=Nocardia TaxID=1817 RepID=UPI002454EADB|nr:aminotransferase class I/II-fold pyridoxal phosphate-dependent enzyme [Nocardia farcinica]